MFSTVFSSFGGFGVPRVVGVGRLAGLELVRFIAGDADFAAPRAEDDLRVPGDALRAPDADDDLRAPDPDDDLRAPDPDDDLRAPEADDVLAPVFAERFAPPQIGRAHV